MKHEVGKIYTDSDRGKYLLIYDRHDGHNRLGYVDLNNGEIITWYDSMEQTDEGDSDDILVGEPLNYFECPDCGYKVQQEEFFKIKR
jgi:hypothetical protein